MPEFIRTAEVVGNIAQKAFNVGKFVLERVTGGGWAEFDHPSEPAHIEVHESNITRGEE